VGEAPDRASVGGVALNAGGGANLKMDGTLYLSALSKSLAAVRVRETMNARVRTRRKFPSGTGVVSGNTVGHL
jgi:ABC-type uncharacterized transport system permease subunit